MTRLAITAVLVMVSYVLVERPYRFRRGSIHIRFLGAAVCVVGVIAAVLAWPTVGPVSAARADSVIAKLTQQNRSSTNVPTATTVAPPTRPATTTPTTPAPTVATTQPPTVATDPPTTTLPPTTAPTTTAPPPVFPGPRRLLVVGDSVADTMRRSFSHQVPPGMAVKDVGKVGCSPAGPDRPQVRFYTGAEALDPCADAVTEWPALVADGHYDGVLMVFGGSGLDRQFGDQWLRPCDAEYNAWFQTAMETDLRALQAQGARVWIALAPYNRHASVAAPDVQAAADRQTDCLNDMYAGAARAVGGVALIDLRGLICATASTCATQIDGIELRPDGLHFTGEGADIIARWLMEQLGPPPG